MKLVQNLLVQLLQYATLIYYILYYFLFYFFLLFDSTLKISDGVYFRRNNRNYFLVLKAEMSVGQPICF